MPHELSARKLWSLLPLSESLPGTLHHGGTTGWCEESDWTGDAGYRDALEAVVAPLTSITKIRICTLAYHNHKERDHGIKMSRNRVMEREPGKGKGVKCLRPSESESERVREHDSDKDINRQIQSHRDRDRSRSRKRQADIIAEIA